MMTSSDNICQGSAPLPEPACDLNAEPGELACRPHLDEARRAQEASDEMDRIIDAWPDARFAAEEADRAYYLAKADEQDRGGL